MYGTYNTNNLEKITFKEFEKETQLRENVHDFTGYKIEGYTIDSIYKNKVYKYWYGKWLWRGVNDEGEIKYFTHRKLVNHLLRGNNSIKVYNRRKRVINLYKAGHTVKEICRELNLPYASVYYYIHYIVNKDNKKFIHLEDNKTLLCIYKSYVNNDTTLSSLCRVYNTTVYRLKEMIKLGKLIYNAPVVIIDKNEYRVILKDIFYNVDTNIMLYIHKDVFYKVKVNAWIKKKVFLGTEETRKKALKKLFNI